MSILAENNLPVVMEANGYFSAKPINTSSTLTGGGVLIPLYETIQDIQNQQAAASYAVSHSVFLNDNLSGTYVIAAVSVSFGTASVSGTLNVEVATGTQAIASGTNQMSATLSLSGTANTPVNGVITTQTPITAGARVNVIFAGTVTSLANAVVSIVLQKTA